MRQLREQVNSHVIELIQNNWDAQRRLSHLYNYIGVSFLLLPACSYMGQLSIAYAHKNPYDLVDLILNVNC